MRGGALPILAWGVLLLVLFVSNWIWDAKAVNAATAAFAAVVVLLIGLALWLSRREAVRRGPPPPDPVPQGLPQASFGAVLAGVSVGAILFGMVWARFLVLFGAAVLLASLGRLVAERRAERRDQGAAARREDR